MTRKSRREYRNTDVTKLTTWQKIDARGGNPITLVIAAVLVWGIGSAVANVWVHIHPETAVHLPEIQE